MWLLEKCIFSIIFCFIIKFQDFNSDLGGHFMFEFSSLIETYLTLSYTPKVAKKKEGPYRYSEINASINHDSSFLIEVLFTIHILSKTTKVCIIRTHINSKNKIYRILVEFKDAELE